MLWRPGPSRLKRRNRTAEAGIDCKTAYATPALELYASRDDHAADLLLDDAYRAATASIDKVDLPSEARAKWHAALIEVRRRWIGVRDADCRLSGYEWSDRSGRAAADITCTTELTKSRIEALKRRAKPN